MLFNSFEFLIFFCIVYPLYLVLKHPWQNRLLVFASLVFYAAWSWKFILLMFVSISTDFLCAKYIDRTDEPEKRKSLLLLSVFVNLSILAIFKYFNFFTENALSLLRIFGVAPSVHWTFKVILPLGVSFYTFEAISYVVDVYRRKIKPAQHYWDYVLFVIYFPHLIAGPIMRAKNFLPQITTPRVWDSQRFYDGCMLFFWGLFEKIYIADNLARIVNPVFAAPAPYKGGTVLVALYAFAFQIFCDFDGYSNMARGLGKCMGFEIAINFKMPYFSQDPKEFWQRWHITLSTWFRDYVYIPMGGNRCSALRSYGNLFVTMILCGFWHGASWTFVAWGFYHALLLSGYRFFHLTGGELTEKAASSRIGWRVLKTFIFFHFVVLGWLLFRARSFHQVGDMLNAMLHAFRMPEFLQAFSGFIGFVILLLIVQCGQWKTGDLLFMRRLPKIYRIAFYALISYCIIGFGIMKSEEFIYFQF